MHGPINVKSPNNTRKWEMGFNSAFKGLIMLTEAELLVRTALSVDNTGTKREENIKLITSTGC